MLMCTPAVEPPLRPEGTPPVSLSVWRASPDELAWRHLRRLLYVCTDCRKHRRRESRGRCQLFSGVRTVLPDDLGPPADAMRHNDMHLRVAPSWLKCLSQVESMLIARIIPVMRIRRMSGGMLSSAGSCTTLPNDMFKVARELPRHASELGLIILRKAGARHDGGRAFAADRRSVQGALTGLVRGDPPGGSPHRPTVDSYFVDVYDVRALYSASADWERYSGPDLPSGERLSGRWFLHIPNRYYSDVVMSQQRRQAVPEERAELPGLPVHEKPARAAGAAEEEEEEGGLAPAQNELPPEVDGDGSVSHSGLVSPIDSKDADAEVPPRSLACPSPLLACADATRFRPAGAPPRPRLARR